MSGHAIRVSGQQPAHALMIFHEMFVKINHMKVVVSVGMEVVKTMKVYMVLVFVMAIYRFIVLVKMRGRRNVRMENFLVRVSTVMTWHSWIVQIQMMNLVHQTI